LYSPIDHNIEILLDKNKDIVPSKIEPKVKRTAKDSLVKNELNSSSKSKKINFNSSQKFIRKDFENSQKLGGSRKIK
jgi:hypothetical protein